MRDHVLEQSLKTVSLPMRPKEQFYVSSATHLSITHAHPSVPEYDG